MFLKHTLNFTSVLKIPKKQLSTKAPKPIVSGSVKVYQLHSEEDIKKAISVSDLPSISEYSQAMMIAFNKPIKAERKVKGLLRNMRNDHIGKGQGVGISGLM